VFVSMKLYSERMADLEFCQDYGLDRIWMKSVGIDVSEMPEEKRFLAAM
jgi:hypothetical protein